jgi:hypothetical protein
MSAKKAKEAASSQDEAASVLGRAELQVERQRGAVLSRDEMVREALAEI